MKKLLILGVALTSMSALSQIHLDFNTQNLPESWSVQGSFDIQDASIYPFCNEKALIGSIFDENASFWVQSETFPFHGEDVIIYLKFGLKDLYYDLGVNTIFHRPVISVQYADATTEDWQDIDVISLEDVNQATTCMEYRTSIPADLLSNMNDIKIRFLYRSPAKQDLIYLLYWSLDEIKVDYNILSTHTPIRSTIAYFPNPVATTLSLQYEEPIQQIVIYNMLGQTLQQLSNIGYNPVIDVAHLPVGNYVVSVQSSSATQSFKIHKL